MLNPDIIFCQRNISRVALNYLLERNVCVVANVRAKVMERMARWTGGEIVSSLDKITLRNETTRLGRCSLFYVKTFETQQPTGLTRKTVMFLDGCDPTIGCTLLLRGPVLSDLTRVKTVVRFMAYASFHLRLETAMLANQNSCILPFPLLKDDKWRFIDDLAEEDQQNVMDDTRFGALLVPYENTLLSSSPFVTFDPPFLLRAMCDAELDLLARLVRLKHGVDGDMEQNETRIMVLRRRLETWYNAFDQFVELLQTGSIADLILTPELDSRVKAGLNYLVEHADAMLSPFYHQNLMVISLFCFVSVWYSFNRFCTAMFVL
jgi:1-phosphatidylinositol-3-phosphate 5-kinase